MMKLLTPRMPYLLTDPALFLLARSHVAPQTPEIHEPAEAYDETDYMGIGAAMPQDIAGMTFVDHLRQAVPEINTSRPSRYVFNEAVLLK